MLSKVVEVDMDINSKNSAMLTKQLPLQLLLQDINSKSSALPTIKLVSPNQVISKNSATDTEVHQQLPLQDMNSKSSALPTIKLVLPNQVISKNSATDTEVHQQLPLQDMNSKSSGAIGNCDGYDDHMTASFTWILMLFPLTLK